MDEEDEAAVPRTMPPPAGAKAARTKARDVEPRRKDETIPRAATVMAIVACLVLLRLWMMSIIT